MFTEDLDAFLSTGDHALAATLQGGAAGGVAVLFDAPYDEVLEVAGTEPTAVCKASAVAAGDIGKTLTVNGVAYTIRGREPIDDGAFVRLRLEAPAS